MSYTGFKKASINKIPGYPGTIREEEYVKACKYFAERYLQQSDKLDRSISSYGLKHVVENWLKICYHVRVPTMFPFGNHCYVSNEALITALAELGYESSPNWKDSPNLNFKLKWVGPKFYNGHKWEMPVSEDDWEKILQVV